jgi:hypothetical protein
MAGARRSLIFAGTLAVAVLAFLVPAAAAAASTSRSVRGHDPGPLPTGVSRDTQPGADPSGSRLSDPTDPVPTDGGPTAPDPSGATQPTQPTDPTHPTHPGHPAPVPTAAPSRPAGPAPTTSSGDPAPAAAGPTTEPAPTTAVDPAQPVPAGGPRRIARPAVAPAPRSATGTGSTPEPSAGWGDVGRPGPDPGSQPRPVVAQAQTQDLGGGSNDPWSFLHGPQAGAHLFVAGFVALLFSIGGLVAVGIRRHRW